MSPQGFYPSNGAHQLVDIAGRVFTKWTVLGRDAAYEGRGTKWVCICACGTTRSVWGFLLQNGRSKSCGCRPRFAPRLGTAAGKLFRQYKDNAKDRGIDWQISFERFKEITSSPCSYTGRQPEGIMRARGGEVYRYNGIDRVDSSVGYVDGNIVPCCKDANYAKLNLSEAAFLDLVREVYLHRRLDHA